MVSFLYHCWFMIALARRVAAWSERSIPSWGLVGWLAGFIVSLCFFMRFSDLSWRDCRRIFLSEENTGQSLTMMEAYEDGFRSLRDYDFSKWLQQREFSKPMALPAGQPVLLLPEGREFFLAKEIDRRWDSANSGCGQWFELFEARFLRSLRALRNRLSEYDLAIFESLLESRHIDLSDANYAAACQAESEVWAEIRAGYDCE